VTRVPSTPPLARLRSQFAPPPDRRVILHRGTCGDNAGAEAVRDALVTAVGDALIEGTLIEGTCDGSCWAAPAATVQRAGHQHRFTHLDHGVPEELARCFAGDSDDEYAGRGEYGLLERLGRQDGTFEDAVTRGAYAAFAHACASGARRALDAIENSSYPARYGALPEGGMLMVAAQQDSPAAFTDRHLLEGDPHRVLEGVLTAALVTGATDARLYLSGQPASARAAFEEALRQAEAHGLLDGSALGGPAIAITVTDALSEGDAIGVEAVSALTTVFDQPPPPTRLVALSGAVPRLGLYEVPVGGATTWTGILAMAGATPGVVPGLRIGAAGDLVARDAFEEIVTPSALADGTVVVLARDAEV
jgi:hypothetical protein